MGVSIGSGSGEGTGRKTDRISVDDLINELVNDANSHLFRRDGERVSIIKLVGSTYRERVESAFSESGIAFYHVDELAGTPEPIGKKHKIELDSYFIINGYSQEEK